MNFVSVTAARDADVTNLTTKNGSLSNQLSQQEYHIRARQEKLCNLKLVSSTKTTNMKGYNKGLQTYAHKKNRNRSGQRIQRRKI